MPGSYTWKAETISHPYGCVCRLDPNYVFCGCQGVGGYFAGPLNPTQYTKELADAKAKSEAEAEQKAKELEAYKSSSTYDEDKAFLKTIFVRSTYTYIDDPRNAEFVKENAEEARNSPPR
ncbi:MULTISPECIES: hypothetical protein [Pseudomonas]|uniref:Uncharacterized protein n=1 Tax=Pseudomonas wuhanensis TaxID=2954098 RepID=A0ABY9GTA5_9PSED|nr:MULTISPECIES: hypothetical protein [unclassified Pseudomonas]WLI13034.1 hypothetical protein PSH65_02325 [Pseudomonas sp. FP603]WLI18914.1 hypothetical protein PSH88_02330 [Pseudomonas sp. FP607]